MIHSLRGKLIVATLLIQIMIIGVLTWNSQQLLEQRLLAQFQSRLATLSPLLAAALLSPLITRDYVLAENTLTAMQVHEDFSYLVLLDNRGRRIAANRWPADQALPPPSPPLSWDDRQRPERFDIRVPIVYAGQTPGEVAYGISLDFLQHALRVHLVQTLAIAVVGLILSATLLITLSLWLTRNLARLTAASEALARGEPHAPLVLTARDEIGTLARSFESMAQALGRRMDELRAAERAATRQTLRYQSLLQTASDGMHVMDPQGKLVEASNSFYRMLGHPVGTPLHVWDWDARWTKDEIIAQLPLRGADDAVFETRHRRADGSLIDVEIVTHGIAIDGQPLIYASARDITARKAAENQLKAFAAEQQTMLNNDIVGIVRLRDRRVAWINEAFASRIGYAPHEVQGMDSRLIYPDDAAYAAMASIYAILLRGEVWRGQTQFVCKDGSLRWFDVSGGLLPDGDSLWSMVDITDLKNALQAAEQASHAKSRFLANMSHELRTPLNGVLGMAQLLKTTTLNGEQSEYTEQIVVHAHSLIRVIDNLLDIAELGTGTLQMETTDFDPTAVFNDVLTPLAARAEEKGLVFERQYDAALPAHLQGDPRRLAQVIDILVGNALKFTARGRVAVRLTLDGSASERLRLRCEVEDSGIGIATTKLGELFTPFSQGDATMTRRFDGNGLGLAIAKQLVEAMGGEIGVSSIEGAGSTFWFTLQACWSPEDRDNQPADSAAAFDPRALLGRLGGDEEMARLLVASLLDDMPARMNGLAAAVAQGDATTARREAHTMKGLAESGGSADLRQAALDIQRLCEQDDLPGAAARLPACRQLLAGATAKWRGYLTGRKVGAGDTPPVA